jgi:ribosome-associated protein
MSKQETRRMVLAAASACEEKKAEDIRILELDPIDSAFTDFFLICSGANARQNQAIADEIELRLKREFGMYANSVEGHRQAEWILLDYVDFVVHIFSTEKRAFYDIERLRKSASSVALDELKKSLAEKVAAVRKKKAVPTKKAPSTPVTKAPTVPAAKKSSVKKAAKKAIGEATKKTTQKTPAKKADAKAVAKKIVLKKTVTKKAVRSVNTKAIKKKK